MRSLKVAFIATSGLWYGGTEKCTQKQAIALVESGHSVDYYYTPFTKYSNGNVHPGLDVNTRLSVESAGVKTIPVRCSSVDAFDPLKAWEDTDLFDKFDPSRYDIVIGNHKGEPMWPYSEISGPKLIEVVHGTDFITGASRYSHGYVLITSYQSPMWQRAGGDMKKSVVIPQEVYVEEPLTDLDRNYWSLPTDKFIFGMHQGARAGLHTGIVLESYKRIESDNSFFVMLGGDPEYSNQAKSLGIRNFLQIPPVSSPAEISSFLSCIDVYAHGRFDGEVSSSAIIEAMSRSLPIISHPSAFNNGHLEQLRNVGIVAVSVDEYTHAMAFVKNNESLRNEMKRRSREKYESFYEPSLCKRLFVEFVENTAGGM